MKSKYYKKKFLLLQWISFILITVISVSVVVYFPNLPTPLRHLIGGIRGNINADKKEFNVDERFLKWFNRDPERNIPSTKNIIISPADGVVEKVFEKTDSKHVVIEMRYTDVHVQRVPISGKVVEIYGGGKEFEEGYDLLDYELDKMLPFQKITIFQTEIGIVKVRQITSFFAKRIEVFLKIDQSYSIGERLGRVLAGSTVVIELPKMVKVIVKEKDVLIAGESIIANY